MRTLAHHGTLFLDELAEFDRDVLEALRQPLEEGRILIARAGRVVTFPARFQLVAAMNPCPCGFAGSYPEDRCRCRPGEIDRYAQRVSGPLRDRIDLWVSMPRVPAATLIGGTEPSGRESSYWRITARLGNGSPDPGDIPCRRDTHAAPPHRGRDGPAGTRRASEAGRS